MIFSLFFSKIKNSIESYPESVMLNFSSMYVPFVFFAYCHTLVCSTFCADDQGSSVRRGKPSALLAPEVEAVMLRAFGYSCCTKCRVAVG